MSASKKHAILRLQRIPLFANLSEDLLQVLAEHLNFESYQPGETIFVEGSDGGSLYAIEEGEVVISKVIDQDDGTEKTLAILGEGTFFGEGGLLKNEPRSATVRARNRLSIIHLSRDGFLEVLHRNPVVAASLLLEITASINLRLKRTSNELVALFDTGKLAGANLGLAELTEKVLERSIEATHSEAGLLLLVHPYTFEIEVGAVRDTGYPELPWPRTDPFLVKVLDEDLAGTEEELPAPGPQVDLPPHFAAIPIRSDDAALGLIVVGRIEEPYERNDVHLLTGISLQIAPAIQNARARDEEEAEKAHRQHYVTF